MKKITGIVFLICFMLTATAQRNLAKSITIQAKQQRLADVLEIISNKGDFFFSYNSSIIRRDSLVSISASNQPVQSVLNQLFNNQYEYRESGNYIIIRRKPIQATVVVTAPPPTEKFYMINGLVSNANNGIPLPDATIYEKQQLANSISAADGSFGIKLKQKYGPASLTISKTEYTDTTVVVKPGMTQMLEVLLYPLENNDVVISPEDYLLPDSVSLVKQTDTGMVQKVPVDSSAADTRWLTKMFVSGKQQLQTLNVGGWIAEKPFSFSLIPGLGSHGRLSGQIINHFSVNILGGYSGGLQGIELGGLFNINRKDAGYLQAAGLFNVTGGKQQGVQLSGISNTVLQSTAGLQAAGVFNTNKTFMHGVQLAGVANINGKGVRGFQGAGVYNHSHDTTKGMQLAGVLNMSNKTLKGVQASGVANYAKHNKGLQLGVINIADSSDGFSIGLINIVLHGYHKLYLGTDEITDANFAIKSGNRKLYSILLGGANFSHTSRLYSFGYGIGSEFISTKRFAMSMDVSSQYLYMGSWDYLNLLNRAKLNLHLRLSRHIAVYGGPSLNVYTSTQTDKIGDYTNVVPRNGYGAFDMNGSWRGWGGWHAGIALF